MDEKPYIRVFDSSAQSENPLPNIIYGVEIVYGRDRFPLRETAPPYRLKFMPKELANLFAKQWASTLRIEAKLKE